MAVVAVAGGTGNVGRTIVETLVESSNYKVIVLGRQAQTILDNVPCYAADYTDLDAVATLLSQYEVGVVISTIQLTDETSSIAEVNLITAAGRVSTVTRFIASCWGSLPNEMSPTLIFQRASETALRSTKLEWTRFFVGFFMDYYGIPAIKTHLSPMSFVESTYVDGEKTTWNAFIKVAEEVTGAQFEVSYDPLEKLARGEVTELPSHKEELVSSPFPEPLARQLLALLGSWVVGGQFDIPAEKALNKIFPYIKLMGVREMFLLRQTS
ncbi:hypothetical protein ACQKWADRAFT_329347 [Trichoderma austrokoningii]